MRPNYDPQFADCAVESLLDRLRSPENIDGDLDQLVGAILGPNLAGLGLTDVTHVGFVTRQLPGF